MAYWLTVCLPYISELEENAVRVDCVQLCLLELLDCVFLILVDSPQFVESLFLLRDHIRLGILHFLSD